MSFSFSPDPTGSHSGPFDPEATELPEVLRQLHVPHRSEGAVIVVAVASAPQDGDWANEACVRTAEMFGRGVGGALLIDTDAGNKGLATLLAVPRSEALKDALRDPSTLEDTAGFVEGHPFRFVPAGRPRGGRRPLLENPSWGSLLAHVTQDGTTVVLRVQLAASGAESIIGRADAVVLLGRAADLLAVLVEGGDGPVVWLGPPAADVDVAAQDDPGDPNARRVRARPAVGIEAGGPDALDGAEDRSEEPPALHPPPTAEATTQQDPGEPPASSAEERERTALEAEFEGLPTIEEVPDEPHRGMNPVVVAGAGVLAAVAAALLLLGRGPTTAMGGSTDTGQSPETAQTSEEDLWTGDPLSALRRENGREVGSKVTPDASEAGAVAAPPEPRASEPAASPEDAAEPSRVAPADPVPADPEPQSLPPSTPPAADPEPRQGSSESRVVEVGAPPAAPPSVEDPAPDLTPPPPNSGVAPGTMAFGVVVGRHASFGAARSQAVSLRSNNPGVMFTVVPVDEGGIVYRVVAGHAATATEAEEMQASLGDVTSGAQATVRATQWTYLLGVFGDYAEAITHVTNVEKGGLPAYLVEIPVGEDRVVYRAYSGAFGTEAEAAALGALLEGAGYAPTRLVERVGRPLR